MSSGKNPTFHLASAPCLPIGAPVVKALRIVAIILVVGILAVFLGAPFLFSRKAPAATVQGTVPPEELAAEGSPSTPAPPALDAPLGDQVVLRQPIIFPVHSHDRPVGHVRAQKGITVNLIADLGPEVVVQLVESQVRIPRSAVVSANPVEAAASSPNLASSVRQARNRIVDYWFSTPVGTVEQ